MKRFAVWMISFAAVLFTGTLRAQDTPSDTVNTVFPVVPMTVNLELVPQFFRQALDAGRNPRFSSIEAQVDASRKPAWYQIVLRERASGKQLYYCNSQDTVNIWTGLGREAYYVPIDFNVTQGPGSQPVYEFQFRDASQTPIRWHFVAGPAKTNRTGFMPRPDDFGLVFLRGEQYFSAASGAFLAVGDQQYPAVDDSFYSAGVLIADIQPVNEQWNLTGAPAQFRAGDKWTVHSSGGRDQLLTIQQASGNSLTVEATEPNFPNRANVRMDLLKSENQYALNSLTVMAQGHTFRIAFDPALPLPVSMAADKMLFNFTMDEDTDRNIASGRVIATRGMGDEHLDWSFDSPTWARPVQLTTGVSVLSRAATQALKKSSPGVP